MRIVHQRRVPKEAEHEEEDEGRDKRKEEFFPIHNFFLLRLYCVPVTLRPFHCKTTGECRSQIFRTRNDE